MEGGEGEGWTTVVFQRSKVDRVGKANQTLFFTNFPESFGKYVFRKLFALGGRVTNIFILVRDKVRRKQDGQKYGFVTFEAVRDVRRLEKKLDSIWIGKGKNQKSWFRKKGPKVRMKHVRGNGPKIRSDMAMSWKLRLDVARILTSTNGWQSVNKVKKVCSNGVMFPISIVEEVSNLVEYGKSSGRKQKTCGLSSLSKRDLECWLQRWEEHEAAMDNLNSNVECWLIGMENLSHSLDEKKGYYMDVNEKEVMFSKTGEVEVAENQQGRGEVGRVRVLGGKRFCGCRSGVPLRFDWREENKHQEQEV
ncbi:hypothetical protein VNO78_16754 [Psophocarpus tetragonolobus]|uniref:RRM domain-containing protein n=1 Tax=Psophocarpus tetragonolobus TaxID=3891 RepID=A0AAN9XKP3_PSOTE